MPTTYLTIRIEDGKNGLIIGAIVLKPERYRPRLLDPSRWIGTDGLDLLTDLIERSVIEVIVSGGNGPLQHDVGSGLVSLGVGSRVLELIVTFPPIDLEDGLGVNNGPIVSLGVGITEIDRGSEHETLATTRSLTEPVDDFHVLG